MCDQAKHAMITGASTGIGRATALRLAAEGYHVFATVRRAEDGESLRREGASAADRITPVLMDVTVPQQVKQAAETIEAQLGGRGLDVLVNNAGVGYFQPLEFIALERFQHHLAVNTVGPLIVAQAMLPAVRRAGGRIVIIGSTAGWLTMPFGGSHAATKHAVVGLADALRQELAAWGIKVVLIEPATVRTNAFAKLEDDFAETMREMGPRGRAMYGEAFEKMTVKVMEVGAQGSDPGVIAKVVLRAVRASRPRLRYLAGKLAFATLLMAKMPSGLIDSMQRSMFGLPKAGSKIGAPEPVDRTTAASSVPAPSSSAAAVPAPAPMPDGRTLVQTAVDD